MGTANAGGDPILKGAVQQESDGEPLPGASVVIVGTMLGATTDAAGRFRIEGAPEGTWIVKALMVGYRTESRDVRIKAMGETTVVFRLSESPVEMAPVVVTASKRAQSPEESPVSLSVVSARELREQNEASLERALAYAPGVHVAGAQIGIRGSTGYSRGAGSRVLLLMDGAPAINADRTTINWDSFPVAEIERIEIIKGAGSALYGSNAIGGVVNLITRAPSATPETRVRLSGGFYSSPHYPEWRWTDRRPTFKGMDISHSRRIGDVGVLVWFGRKVSDGYRQNGDYSRWGAMTKVEYSDVARTRTSLLCHWALEDHGEPILWKRQEEALKVAPEAVGDNVHSPKFHGILTVRRIVSRMLACTVRGSYYWTHWTHDFHDSQDYAASGRPGGEIKFELLPSRMHALTFGMEGMYTDVNSRMFGDHNTFDLGVYAQDEARVSPLLSLTFGARYDRHGVDRGRREDQFSPKVGLSYRYAVNGTFRASVGRGFRAPSIAEMFSDTRISGFRIVPNPELRAEDAWSSEVGIRHTGRFYTLDASAFRSEYRDMIEPEPVGEAFHLANLTRGRLYGAEVTFGASWRGLLMGRMNYVYLHTEDVDAGQPLAYRPAHQCTGDIALQLGPVRASGDLRYHTRVEEVKAFPQDERVPMYVVGARATLGPRRMRALGGDGEIEFQFKADNLLQYHYVEVERNLEPIRSFTFTVSVRR